MQVNSQNFLLNQRPRLDPPSLLAIVSQNRVHLSIQTLAAFVDHFLPQLLLPLLNLLISKIISKVPKVFIHQVVGLLIGERLYLSKSDGAVLVYLYHFF